MFLQEREPELFLYYRGVKVFHCYSATRCNEAGVPWRSYEWFQTEAGHVFNIRSLPSYNAAYIESWMQVDASIQSMAKAQKEILKEVIDKGFLPVN